MCKSIVEQNMVHINNSYVKTLKTLTSYNAIIETQLSITILQFLYLNIRQQLHNIQHHFTIIRMNQQLQNYHEKTRVYKNHRNQGGIQSSIN